MDIEDISKRLLGLIQASDVDEGEVYIQTARGLEIVLRDQAVERLRNKETAGFALRLISDRRMAFLHSSDLRDTSLEQTVQKGVELARTAAPDESNYLIEPAQGGAQVETYDESIEGITFERKVNLLKDIETLAFAYDPSISKIELLVYEDSRIDTVVANTNGVFWHDRSTKFSVSVSVVAESAGDVETGGEWAESRFFEDLDPPSRIARRACWKATSLLGGGPISTQTVPVIFDRDVGSAFLAHIFAMVNGDNIANGLSMLEGRIGEAVGSPLVTIVDDATVDRGIGSREFDDEGTPSARTVVVDRGVLKSFLFDTRTARKSGFTSTGNAKRGNFRQVPSVGFTNLFLEKGEATPDEIIRSTRSGLWVISLAGWWVAINPSTGDFSSGAKGLWIDGGEVAYPVRNVTVASNVLDMLKAVDAVGNDLLLRHQSSSPTFRIGEMNVGGI